jgi:hypothetical protein
VGRTIQAGACTFHLAPLVILGNAPYLSVFKTKQLQALAYMFFKIVYPDLPHCSGIFWILCLLVGYLIFKSDSLPRILGVLMALAGLGWSTFLSPPFGAKYFPYLLATGAVGEGALALWLLIIIFPGFAKVVNLWWFDSPMAIFEIVTSFWLLFKGLRAAGIAEPNKGSERAQAGAT